MLEMENRRLKSVDNFISNVPTPYDEWIQEIRDLIHECVPNVEEELKLNTPYFVKDYNICNVTYNDKSKYISFNFNDASQLDDPDKVLQGTGKKMRHVKIYYYDDLRKDLFAKWLRSYNEL